MSPSEPNAASVPNPAPPPEKRTWTPLRILGWTVATLCASTLTILVLLPLLQQPRINLRSAQQLNNGKQLGLAVHNCHSQYKALPVDVVGESDAPPVAWMTALLPYADQGELYTTIDFDKPYDAPENAAVFQTDVPVYQSIYVDRPAAVGGLAPAHWAANVEVFTPGRTLPDLPDGMSQTLLIAEVHAETGAPAAWGDPENKRSASAAVNGPLGFGGYSHDGFIAVLADGSVRFLDDDIDPETLAALGTPDGGEVIDDW